jgi:hypothetical protein
MEKSKVSKINMSDMRSAIFNTKSSSATANIFVKHHPVSITLKNTELKKANKIIQSTCIPNSKNDNFVKEFTNVKINKKIIKANNYINKPSIDSSSTQSLSSPKKNLSSPSKWKKYFNLVRSLRAFNQHEVRNIFNDNDIDKDLEDYRVRLHDNTKHNREIQIQNEKMHTDNLANKLFEKLKKAILINIEE